jgi:hypothetical protein
MQKVAGVIHRVDRMLPSAKMSTRRPGKITLRTLEEIQRPSRCFRTGACLLQ